MWKKPEEENSELPAQRSKKTPIEQLKQKAVVGPSIQIKGELTGEEDLVIQGRVEGRIELKKNNVTVGKKGHVQANVYGKIISVEGEVEGDLFGEEKIIVRQSGIVRGNMTAPRVNLEDGAKFKGSIDMKSEDGEKKLPLEKASIGPKSAPSQIEPGSVPKEEPAKSTPKNKEHRVGVKADTPRA
jgi:cytoskeletal protein CcmA (bactofilin family)